MTWCNTQVTLYAATDVRIAKTSKTTAGLSTGDGAATVAAMPACQIRTADAVPASSEPLLVVLLLLLLLLASCCCWSLPGPGPAFVAATQAQAAAAAAAAGADSVTLLSGESLLLLLLLLSPCHR
jgi:hypothetical protein